MASFGRRPKKDAGTAASRASGRSDTFRKMMEEEEDREKFAKEHAEREDGGPDEKTDKVVHKKDEEKDGVRKHRGPNPRVFFQIELRSKVTAKKIAAGKLEFELFADTAPKTAENFRSLCTGEKSRELHLALSAFHKITPGLAAEGGDIVSGDGTGGRSIYGEPFDDENFLRFHDARGILSMANTGRNTNTSRFHIMFKRASHMDKKHVVFGKMVRDDDDVLKAMEDAGTSSGVPRSMVSIIDCGEVGGQQNRTAEKSRSRSRGRVKFDQNGRISYRALRRDKDDDRRK